MTKLETEHSAFFYCTRVRDSSVVRDSSGKPAGKLSTLETGMKYTKLTSVRNWKKLPQSWKLCGAGKLSRAGATNKDSSFVRMTKLENEYCAYFYCTSVRHSSGKHAGKWSRLETFMNYSSLTSDWNWKAPPQSWKLCGAEELGF